MNKLLYNVVLLSLCAFLIPSFVSAATMRIAPAAASVTVGGTASIAIQVTSADQPMNAASGIVHFPADSLQVVSLSKSGTIISLWAQEPSYSNSAGTINFEGAVLNPGFTGSNGTVLTITFKAKSAGVAPITIGSGSVLANDGSGTEILTSVSGGNMSVTAAAPAPAVTPSAPASPTAARLVITSTTHPDAEKSYRAPVVHLAWNNPPGTEAVRILYDKNQGTTPSVTYDPPIESKEIEPGDGTWYFHAQARSGGGWGPVTHFKFTIDPNAPEEVVPAEPPMPQLPVTHNATPSLFSSITQWILGSQTMLLEIALAISLLMLALVSLSHKRSLRQTHGGRVRHVHDLVHREFNDLKDALTDELSALNRAQSKRNLTTEEKRIVARFTKMLDTSERTIGTEIDELGTKG